MNDTELDSRFDSSKEENAFRAYTARYDPNNPKIQLKIFHTFQVVEAADRIAQSLDLTGYERRLIHLAALFHDVGRFEQVRQYGTYFDALSIDHAALGARILEEEEFLKSLSEPERRSVIEAVRVHNRLFLPESHTGFQKTIDQIVRDADKIDIFRVAAAEHPEDTTGYPLQAVEGMQISSGVWKALMEGRSVPKEERKNALDLWVSFLGFIFDLNFPVSFTMVLEQNFWKKPLENLVRSGLISDPETCAQIGELLKRTESALEKGKSL